MKGDVGEKYVHEDFVAIAKSFAQNLNHVYSLGNKCSFLQYSIYMEAFAATS